MNLLHIQLSRQEVTLPHSTTTHPDPNFKLDLLFASFIITFIAAPHALYWCHDNSGWQIANVDLKV